MLADISPRPVEKARALAELLAATSGEIERSGRIPEPLISRLHDARLFRMLLPRSVGGDEVAPWTYLAAVHEVARHDASVAWNIFVANSTVLIAPFLEENIARSIYDDPRALIAWGPPNACKAKAVDGGYLVHGTWDFASGCRQATWMGAHCQVIETDGSLRKNSYGRPATLTFLFPVAKAHIRDTWNTIGLRGTGSDTYDVENLLVSEAYTTTREEPEQRRIPGKLYAFTMQGLYAVGVAGVALGTARAMLEAMKTLAGSKQPRGQGVLRDAAAIQAGVARAEARLGSAMAYLESILQSIWDRAEAWAVIDIDDRASVRLGCANAIHGSIEVVDWVYKAAGVDAIFPGSPFERRFRDMHTLSQQIQSRDSHFEAVGQIQLGLKPAVFY